MEPKVGPIHTSAYEEFEPYCNWNRQTDEDTLIVYLPDFKKEHLRVMVSSNGLLKIFGERPIDATKKSRFYKEIPVPADCNSAGIHAKFVNDRLRIIMPKKTHSETQQQQQPQADHEDDDQSKNKAALMEEEGIKEKPTSSSSMGTDSEFQTRDRSVLRLKRFGKVALMVVVIWALITYAMHKYRSIFVEEH